MRLPARPAAPEQAWPAVSGVRPCYKATAFPRPSPFAPAGWTVSPTEGFSSQRTRVFPFACGPDAAAGQAMVEAAQSAMQLPGAYGLITRCCCGPISCPLSFLCSRRCCKPGRYMAACHVRANRLAPH